MPNNSQFPPATTSRILGEPWLIYDPALGEFLAKLAEGIPADIKADDDFFTATGAGEDEEIDRPYHIDEDGTAYINFHGVVGKRLERWMVRWFGMLDLDTFDAIMNMAAEDEAVKRIHIDFDSPGGSVTGMLETMKNVRRIAQVKQVTAFTEMLMASAAYFIGSQATRVIATESARIGSIGAMMTFIDRSKAMAEYGIKIELITNREAIYKGANAYGKGLTKDQRTQFQETTQNLYDLGYQRIKAARPGLKDDWARGQVVHGHEAFWQGSGLIDDLV